MAGCSRGSTRLPDAADPSDCRRDCKSANTVKGPGRHTLRHSFATPGGRRRCRSYPGPAGERKLDTRPSAQARPADVLRASPPANLAFSKWRRARPTGERAATRSRSPICSVLPGLPIRSRMQASSASAAQGHVGDRALPHGRRTRPTADRAQLPWSSDTSMRLNCHPHPPSAESHEFAQAWQMSRDRFDPNSIRLSPRDVMLARSARTEARPGASDVEIDQSSNPWTVATLGRFEL